MNKSELAARVADSVSLPISEVNQAINAVFDQIGEALANGETVRVPGFGTFSSRSRAERQGRHPRTGERITIAASRTAAFKPGKALRDAVR